ncbi:MFS general substrate transporter [Annulohypoxylon truncatum]|uniref:MFS general substrate transporter n=1 Tax=Annulohypoxylon truncatum TaxID=327061 RepID=UPI002008A978|nr:MFS general substrate transporter [Annulohypoxylon truncatum]KAI1205188.1 MFS general substrate transporter [Annulohypoxylon truncatum]
MRESPDGEGAPSEVPKPRHSLRFWGTFVALCLLSFISALDVAIVTTALPNIIDSVGGASQYVWIANSFVVASAVLQPLTGQLANALGRRGPLIASTALFALGSGVGGGAHSAAMLIAGRVVQGVGAGGINVLLDIVCCDLVPLRERGKYLGLMFSWSGIAAALGPPVGGALAQSNWRWIFWLNLPVCGLALAALLLFMRVKTGGPIATDPDTQTERLDEGGRRRTIVGKLKRLDFLGNALFTLSMVSLLLGLVEGGTVHPWSSWRIILPLVLGVVGWITFHIQQHFAAHASVPTRLFTNRTSATAYLLTFLTSVLVQTLAYFLPIYFQAVKATTILESGVDFLPMAIGTLVFAVVAGILLSHLGKYRILHIISLALSILAFGLMTRLNADTSKVEWAWYELIGSMSSGLTLSTLLPAIMAGLPERDVAVASSTYSFIRTFGWIWGVTAPGIIFTAIFDGNLDQISDLGLRKQLSGGQAYSFASQVHNVRNKYSKAVTAVYIESLRAIWWFGLGVSILALLAIAGEKELELRKELETDYGLEEAKGHVQN